MELLSIILEVCHACINIGKRGMQELFFCELKALEVAALTLNRLIQHVCLVMMYRAERKKIE